MISIWYFILLLSWYPRTKQSIQRILRIIGRYRPAMSGRRRRNTSRLVPNNRCGRYRKGAEIGRTETRKQSKHNEENTNQHANDTGAKASARPDRGRVQPENILKSDEEAGILRRPPCCCCSAGDLSADQESSEAVLPRNESLSDELSVSVSVRRRQRGRLERCTEAILEDALDVDARPGVEAVRRRVASRRRAARGRRQHRNRLCPPGTIFKNALDVGAGNRIEAVLGPVGGAGRSTLGHLQRCDLLTRR
ncbi:unnamed protein product [Mycena citricolor]|uniref:Uncharacterized protein n=1 Tax=Mycena citricolor TaxID=2018698 RepID=A0AAD2H8V6_9AGAR|nr:unnamed protein product [Mycena citricolor]